MILAIHTIVSISMNHLRLRSVQQVRSETLAEHRRFLSRLDHELKNPLTALRAGLKTLVLTPLNEQQGQIVETMETETLRLSRLVSDLRKLAELETEPLNLQPVSLQEFINNVLLVERERFEAGQRALTTHIRSNRETWTVDQVELSIEVNEELIVRVTDTGDGIPPAALPHVWEELYRGQQIEKIPGSGTGLALVKAIVERHQGSIKVESIVRAQPANEAGLVDHDSARPAHGTSVTLRLPELSL
jgi:two-component system OmpR family sensor kinase